MSELSFKELRERLEEIESNIDFDDSCDHEHIDVEIKEAEEDEVEGFKSAVAFNQLADVLFPTADLEAGKVALRKAMRGDALSLRDRGVMADAMTSLLPIIANDRNIFNRISQKQADE